LQIGGWQVDPAAIDVRCFGVESECTRADDAAVDDEAQQVLFGRLAVADRAFPHALQDAELRA